MVRLVLGVAVGYVLGARAGRERYEQMKRLTAMATDNPAVHGLGGFLQAKVSAVLPNGRRHEPRRPDPAHLDTPHLDGADLDRSPV